MLLLLLLLSLLLLLLIISFCIEIVVIIVIYYYYQVLCCHYLFCFDGARLWRGLEVWQISDDVQNKRDGGNHEVDENDDNTFYIYVRFLFIYLLICLFMYLFSYLFISSFKSLKSIISLDLFGQKGVI